MAVEQLARAFHVRLPDRAIEKLESESRREGIPVSALIRRSVLRAYFSDGDSTNSQEDTTDSQEEGRLEDEEAVNPAPLATRPPGPVGD